MMNPAFETYIQSLTGRDVTVIGVGVSNAPLIRMLCSAGAIVTVRDRNPVSLSHFRRDRFGR
jgi:UDP-N-acetylmuramoylalanine--D-glutamate ligase